MQNWETPKQFKPVSSSCFVHIYRMSTVSLKSCGSVTLDARFRQSISLGIIKGNGCKARQTSKEQNKYGTIYVGSFKTMLAPHTCGLNDVTFPFLLVRTLTGPRGVWFCNLWFTQGFTYYLEEGHTVSLSITWTNRLWHARFCTMLTHSKICALNLYTVHHKESQDMMY